MPDALLHELRDLETALHQPDVRNDIHRLEALLHGSFSEFGRSGRSYGRDDILRELPSEGADAAIWSQDFRLEEIVSGVALLTYNSASIHEDGTLSRYTRRSSLWQHSEHGWQLRFHQGTPTTAFAKKAG